MNPYRSQIMIFAVLAAFSMLTGCRPSEPEGGQARTEASPTPAPTPVPTPPPAPVAPTPPPMSSDMSSDLTTSDLPTDRPLRAAFLVVDGVYNMELMAPYGVFQHTKSQTQPGMEVFTVSPDGQPVTTFEGIRVTPTYGFQNAPEADVLVVPSTAGSMDRDLQNQALIDWVRQAGGRARHVVSLRDGAFVLAKAGLLDGVPATTFSDDYKRLAQMFPNVDLRINVSFVDAGKFLTSQGGARSYDVAMHLVDRLYGPETAKQIGHGLLIPWPPDPRWVKSETAIPSAAGQPEPGK